MNKSMRFYSDRHEKSICKELGGLQTTNSGAAKFSGGDVVIADASVLIEAKCAISPKQSVSIKKDWIKTNRENAFNQRLTNSAVCFNFGEAENFYIIDSKLMKFLIESLKNNLTNQ